MRLWAFRVLGRVLQQELDDLRRILQAMRMMPHTGLRNHLNGTAQLAVALLENPRILLQRNDLVGVAATLRIGTPLGGQRLQAIDWTDLSRSPQSPHSGRRP